MTAPLPPEWLALDPHPGGPHWAACERTHPGCAWKAGVRHGHEVAAHFILDLIRPGDPGERIRALTEAARLVWRLAGPDLNGAPVPHTPDIAALEAEAAKLAAAEARDAADEATDRAALTGSATDDAAHL
ncbi:hypothetical protein [Nonomuraea sp. NPDC005650]|uniref:hypothetical protein n=1 Tax=Nonomuraea sp. NPDC005650 TaxID=3157045 RepID=UPI0033BD3F13